MKKLYFIAIYPPKSIIDEIRIFKEHLAFRFNNSKALKNDAHITLLSPFSREVELESDIHAAFQKINTRLSPFTINLNGFGSFPNPKNPVLFIKPEENKNLVQLFLNVKEKFSFARSSFNPHLTVGYRDLTYENFLKAWKIYQCMEYKAQFTVDRILLLRYNAGWVPISEKQLTAE